MIILKPECRRIDLAPDYHIDIAPGDHLIIRAGVTLNKPAAAGFSHSNLIQRAETLHWFKRQLPQGGKRWWSRAGVDFFFAIPKAQIAVSEQPGYSYVHAEIGGVPVTFNVSGGTENGWTDWVRENVSIGINHPIRDLKRIADAAISAEEATTRGIVVPLEPMCPEDRKAFDQAAARAALSGKLRAGLTIVLAEGYSYGEEKELQVERKIGRQIIASSRSGSSIRVRYSNIDWLASAARQERGRK